MGRGLLSVRAGGGLALGNVHLESPMARVQPATRRAQLELCTALLAQEAVSTIARARTSVAETSSSSSSSSSSAAAGAGAPSAAVPQDGSSSGGGAATTAASADNGGDDNIGRWFLLGDFNFVSEDEDPGIPGAGAVDLWAVLRPGEAGHTFDHRANANIRQPYVLPCSQLLHPLQ